MADVRPIANAAWGGRAADGTAPATPEPVVEPRSVAVADFASILLLIVGTIAGMIGAALWLHPAAALVVLWITALPVALLIGWGDRR